MYQRIGFQYFAETLFEDAGNNFFNGHLDPRVLVSYYPELRGNLFNETDQVDLFAGVAERMPKDASVDDISEYLTPSSRARPCNCRMSSFSTMHCSKSLDIH